MWRRIVLVSLVVSFLGSGSLALSQPKVPPSLDRITTELAKISKELKLQDQIGYREAADAMAFAYGTAIVKIKPSPQFGDWDDRIKNETVVSVYLICPIFNYPNLPERPDKYRTEVVKIRKYLYAGGFERMVNRFGIRARFSTITYSEFMEKKPKNLAEMIKGPEELFDLTLFAEMERLRDRFK